MDSLCLASEPPGETQGVVKLALGFKQRLASLIGDNAGQVIAVLADQGVPFEQTLCTSSGVDFAECFESFVGGFDCWVDVFGDVVGCCCPYFAVAWV